MTTAELLKKIEAEGLEWVLHYYESEPTDDDDLAFEFDETYRCLQKYKEQAARFESLIRKAAPREEG